MDGKDERHGRSVGTAVRAVGVLSFICYPATCAPRAVAAAPPLLNQRRQSFLDDQYSLSQTDVTPPGVVGRSIGRQAQRARRHSARGWVGEGKRNLFARVVNGRLSGEERTLVHSTSLVRSWVGARAPQNVTHRDLTLPGYSRALLFFYSLLVICL